MARYFHILFALLTLLLNLPLAAQEPSEGPLFVNEGETVVYHLSRDPEGRKGTVSDALQNVPGVKVDTEGQINLRGVSQVEIFINGKPSHFDEESQKNYLQQVSAAAILRIEVMTNPSARYTTATNTGVINIITDAQNQSERHLSIGLQSNTQPEVSPWISYIWSTPKTSFTANLKGTWYNTRKHTESYSYSFVDALDRALDTANYILSHRDDTARYASMEVFLKGEYHPDDNNDFMVYFSITPRKSKTISLSNTYRKEFIDDIGEYEYDVFSDNDQLMTYGSVGASWHHRFPKGGHSLGLQLYSGYDFGGGTAKEIRTFKEQPYLNRDIYQTNDFIDIGNEAKLEYTYPYHQNGELYVSLTNTFMPDNNIGLYDTMGTDGYVTDWMRSENRKFSRDFLSGTIMVQHRFDKLTVKPGLSYETSFMRARYYDTPEYDTLMCFSHWLPSLHLSYRTESQHNFSLGYTRKTNYPWMRYFTRRINYEEESFSTGNPLLKPTLIDAFELSWAKYWESFGSANIKGYYNNSINAINQVRDVTYDAFFGRVVPYSKPVNLNKYYEVGGEVNLTYRPSATFNVRLEANVFDSYIETLYDKTQDSVIISELWAYNLRLSTWAKLWDKLEVHASAYYNSPTQTLFATSQTAYGIDCGLRADFFNKRLSVLLNAYDIFNWNKEDNYTFNPYYISYSSYKANSRYVSLEVVYRIL
ncbi:MAG: outer membrane beta-barrel protein [Bacteroidales bacterium]|nr:outer membrane beta-barrel protein [Bacteroidales bacterium]